ncbi:MAG: winged helix DNA-binding protein [Nevskia sp.]|nr:winged helix DNA-binding protein [Nevskia sp.]
MSKPRGETPSESPPKPLLSALLAFFFPVHYRMGMDLEKCMCQGRISRKQAAILWLIESEVGADGWMRRRQIEQMLSSWFEISNSNVSQVLRELARPPLSLVRLIENPASGREKVVALTPEGKAFFETMLKAAIDYIGTELSHLTAEELRWGVGFFGLAFQPQRDEDSGQRTQAALARPPERIARRHG